MPGLTVDSDRLRSDVAAHYDDLDRFYREIWGEHVHHGLWTSPRSTPEEATRSLIDLVAGQAPNVHAWPDQRAPGLSRVRRAALLCAQHLPLGIHGAWVRSAVVAHVNLPLPA